MCKTSPVVKQFLAIAGCEFIFLQNFPFYELIELKIYLITYRQYIVIRIWIVFILDDN